MNKFLRRTVLAALLAALCLTLAACGGSGSDDSAPDTIQDMAKDDTVQFDYGDYLGIWSNGTGDYDSFEVEPGESGEVRWLLYAGANWEYSGYLQYVEEYGYVYAYNDHNGTAYRCELDGAELTVAEIGTFTYGGRFPGRGARTHGRRLCIGRRLVSGRRRGRRQPLGDHCGRRLDPAGLHRRHGRHDGLRRAHPLPGGGQLVRPFHHAG